MPFDGWAWRDVWLEVIGMQFDEARYQKVAGEVQSARRRGALADFGDVPVSDRNPAGLEHAVLEHQPRVAYHEGWLFQRRHRSAPDAVVAKAPTSTIRSATWSRTSRS